MLKYTDKVHHSTNGMIIIIIYDLPVYNVVVIIFYFIDFRSSV